MAQATEKEDCTPHGETSEIDSSAQQKIRSSPERRFETFGQSGAGSGFKAAKVGGVRVTDGDTGPFFTLSAELEGI